MAQTRTGAIRMGHSEDNGKWEGVGGGGGHFCEGGRELAPGEGSGLLYPHNVNSVPGRGSTCVGRFMCLLPLPECPRVPKAPTVFWPLVTRGGRDQNSGWILEQPL